MKGVPDGFRLPSTLNGRGPRPGVEDVGAERFDDMPSTDRFVDDLTAGAGRPSSASPDLLIWYGDKAPEPPPWLVRDLVPQAQIAIIAGQWGAGKTFVGVDLSVSVMLGLPFAGREMVRSGAILWLAAEGASEIDVRVRAAAIERKGDDPGRLPFARQAFDVPRLTAPEAESQLIALADAFKRGLAQRFPGCSLAAIVVDTLGSAAGWMDANSSSEAQAVMNMLRRVNTRTGALLIVVDHYGKIAETGVMGASAKPQSAEVILAALSDRDLAGTRVLKEAAERELVATRELTAGDPQDWIWLTARGAGAEA